MTEPNREKQVERDKAKMVKELEELQKHCPFKPKIVKKRTKNTSVSRSQMLGNSNS